MERIIEVEFLPDDLQEIRTLLVSSEQLEEDALMWLLRDGLDQFQRDEALWRELGDHHAHAADAVTQELKRRETEALLISMRSRTVRSEIAMHELGSQVRGLEELHTAQHQRAALLRRSIARLRHRIAQVEEALGRRAPAVEPARPSLKKRLVRLVIRRHA